MSEALPQSKWLFSREVDLSVFLGSAVLSLFLLVFGWQIGILNDESPDWTWISAVLLIDIAHVWSTSFRVYFDVEEFKRRVWLYTLVPIFGYLVGVALYSEGELVFLEGFGFAGGVSFCASAIWLGCALSAEIGRKFKSDLVDRCHSRLSCNDLSVGVLDDIFAAKF